MTINTSLHKNIMSQILKSIYTDTSISSYLGFKGGTAAYLFYGLGRFSVDLDFDLLDESKKDFIFDKIGIIAKEYGQLRDANKKRYTLFFLLSYEEKAQNIKIEINCRSFGSHYEIKTYLGVSMLVMVKADMFANKLVAVYERDGKANRDIYDIWFFLKNNWPINKKIVEQRTNMPFQDFLQKGIQLLKQVSNRNILSGMGELLDEKKKQWAKTHLLTDTIFLLKLLQNN